MTELAHHALLILSVGALAGAAIRLASLAAPSGPERVLAASALGAGAAAIEALGLALVGLGGDPVALSAAAGAAWLAARRWLPRPRLPVRKELAASWRGLGTGGRALAGALAGLAVVTSAWHLRHPTLDTDTLAYHLSQVVTWVHEGRPGAIETVSYEFPVGNYPLTNEVLLAWATGIARSFVPVMLWQPAMLALLVLAGWVGLRRLGVPRLPAALAVTALASAPLLVAQLNGAKNDLPALAWLVCSGALAAASVRRPALLAPAVVAAGLAVGTKTPALLPVALALALAIAVNRSRLRPLALPLGVAGAAALVIGGTWYARNLVAHGSPFWPFVAFPWGDPLPPFIDRMSDSLLDRPDQTLDGRLGSYRDRLAGGVILLAGGLAVPLLARRRAPLAAAGTVAVMLLVWAGAPATGAPDPPVQDVSLTTVRYLLPTIAVAALALGLAARGTGVGGVAAIFALAGGAIWNLERDLELGFGAVPPDSQLLGAGALGAVAAVLLARVRIPRAARAAAAPVTAALAASLLALAASGYLERHADARPYHSAELVGWFAARPGFERDERPIWMAPTVLGLLAGDTLQRRPELIPADEPCARVRERRRAGWVVIRLRRAAATLHPFTAGRCLAGIEPAYRNPSYLAYAPTGERQRPGLDRAGGLKEARRAR
jgi:hypothetical protein